MTANNVIKKTITGGHEFNLAGKPQNRLIEFEIPSEVILPLRTADGKSIKPTVAVGDVVKAGQVVAEGNKDSQSPVHSSVHGTVKEITSDKIVITAEKVKEWEPLADHRADWRNLSAEQLNKLLISSGVGSLDEQALLAAARGKVKNVIIESVEDTPYALSSVVLLGEGNLKNFVEGIRILKALLPKSSFHLALNSKQTRLQRDLTEAAGDILGLTFYSLAPKYPQSRKQMLTKTILGDEVNIGNTIILSFAAVLHVYEAVVLGKPVIERIIALGGRGWRENLCLKVRIGTPLQAIANEHLRQDGEFRLIQNNLVSKPALQDLSQPIGTNVSSLAAIPERAPKQAGSRLRALFSVFNPDNEEGFSTEVDGEVRPCIFCNRCEDVCPAGLIPHLLEKYVKRDLIGEELVQYGIYDCIDCNLCSYVCPSRLPIARLIKHGRKQLAAERTALSS